LGNLKGKADLGDLSVWGISFKIGLYEMCGVDSSGSGQGSVQVVVVVVVVNAVMNHRFL